VVREVAQAIGAELRAEGILAGGALAIQAIAFDKNPTTNWKVTWHQDLMFPFARRPESGGFSARCQKDGVDYARPPAAILADMLAVRLHLDACDAENGPLRVAPGTHAAGIIPSAEIAGIVSTTGATVCLAREGEALLMRPLLLHASSPASRPRRRRVLHLVFYSGAAISEPWHQAVGARS